MDLKLRNNEDKTIFELKLEEPEEEKSRPGKIFKRLLILVIALAASVGAGYLLYKLTA